jgi:hypothetical protein
VTGPAGEGGGAERRSFYRVSARLPIRLRALDPGESASLACEIAASPASAVAVADPALRAALESLERKLDRVLACLEPGAAERPLGRTDAREVELSGAGVSLEADEELDPADEVLVELELPGSPPRRVRALAHPVPARGPGGKPRRAFAFDAISEEDRDAIVRFSHEVQRSELRERARRGAER